MRALALLVLAACAGESGTIDLELATAPGSTLLDSVQHLRITITEPRTVVEADRTDTGFNIVLDVEASGGTGSLIVEGFDGGGALIAIGSSPPFPVAAITARIVVYMAVPNTIAASPSKLPSPRRDAASAALTFGMAIAGGIDAAGARSDEIFIYNAFDHSIIEGLAMPAPRSRLTAAVGSNNGVYLFGGEGPDVNPTGTLWRFDTTSPPSGLYQELAEPVELARSGASAVQLGTERFVITGTPPIDLVFNVVAANAGPALDANGASVVVDGVPIALFAGTPITRLVDATFDSLAGSAESTATAAALPGGRIVFAGGTAPDLVVVDAALGSDQRLVGALSTVRVRPAVAATPRHLVVAGGTDAAGTPIATADLFDVVTLVRLATVPCLARSGAQAFAFLNDQVAIVGGTPENDQIELFTPGP